jgi:hypothetical protein
MHENIERDGNGIRANVKIFQGFTKVAKTTLVRVLVPINNAKGVSTARRKQEIVASDSVFYDLEHDIAAVGIERVTGSEKDSFGIVYSSTGGKIFRLVMQVVADKIGHLFAFYINYFQPLSFF